MGSVFISWSVPAEGLGAISEKEKKRIVEVVKDKQSSDAYESGHSYSGKSNMCPGVLITNKTFPSISQATDWIAENHEKREPLYAVRVEQRELTYAEMEKVGALLQDEIKLVTSLRAKPEAILRAALDALAKGKTAFRKCKACGSSISTAVFVKQFRSDHCPVCQTTGFVLTPTHNKQIAAAKAKLAKAQDSLDAKRLRAAKKLGINAGPAWVIGGWCAS